MYNATLAEGNAFAYVVLIKYVMDSVTTYCTGCTIGKDQVITAKRCFGVGSVRLDRVYIVVDKAASKLELRPVSVVAHHELVVFTVAPRQLAMKLPCCEELLRECLVAGKGETGRYDMGVTHWAQADLITGELCERKLGLADVLCANVFDGNGPCEGDLGACLVCNKALTGVLIDVRSEPNGSYCGRSTGGLLVYADLLQFRPWIKKTLLGKALKSSKMSIEEDMVQLRRMARYHPGPDLDLHDKKSKSRGAGEYNRKRGGKKGWGIESSSCGLSLSFTSTLTLFFFTTTY